ncbi:MAG: DUF502 domain-containing protein [Methylohalobius sp.]|nr:DUF502 domain-containing protein [Methylohalobius sp.]
MKQSWQKLVDYFLLGVLGILPIVIIVQIVVYIEKLLRNFVLNIYGRYESVTVTLVLFAAAMVFLTYFGYLLRQERAHLLYYLEALIERVPLLGAIYRVTKKVIALFREDGKTKLRQVVYVEYPKDGVWVPAYVTNQVGENYVLYVPTSPNPTSGFTIIVHHSKVIPSAMDIEQASSFVISVGVDLSQPEEAAKLPK